MANAVAYSQGSELGLPVQLIGAMKMLADASFRPSIREILDALMGALDGSGDTEAIKKVLTPALWQKVQDEWTSLKSRAIDKLPAKLRPLAFQLSDLADAIDVPLITVGTTAPLGAYFNVEGNLAVGLEIQAAKALDPPLSDGVVLLADESALRLGLDGRVAAKVNGEATFGWGSVRAGADAAAQADLDFYYARPSKEYLGWSLLTIGSAPFDFADIAALRAARTRGLRRVALVAKGTLAVNAGITAGVSAVYSLGSSSIAPQQIKPIGKVGGSLDVSVSVAGEYAVTVDLEENGDIFVAVSRSGKKDSSLSLELGADVEIDGLSAQADAIVNVALPSAEKLLKVVGDYSDPVSLLRARLVSDVGKALKTEPLKSSAGALALLLTGGTSAADAADVISTSVAKRLTDELDERVARSLEDGTSAIAQLSKDASARLLEWLGPELADKIQSTLQGLFEKGLTAISSDLDQAVADGLKKAKEPLSEVLAPLAAVGQDVAALAAKVKKDVTAALAPIRAWIVKYQKLRMSAVAVLKKAGAEKLAIAISASIDRSLQNQVLMSCRISASNADLDDFFRGLWIGRLDLNAVLPSSGISPPGVVVTSTSFIQTLQDKRTASFSINIFGFAATDTTTTVVSDVTIDRDASGRIIMAKSAAAFSEATKAFDYVKTARIDLGFDVSTDAGKTVLNGPNITTAYAVADKSISIDGVFQYLQSLADSGLLSEGGLARAKDTIFRSGARQQRQLDDMTIALKMVIDPAGWLPWLALDASKFSDTVASAYFDAGSSFRLPGFDFKMGIGRLAARQGTDEFSTFKALCDSGPYARVGNRIEQIEGNSLENLSGALRSAYRTIQQCASAAFSVSQAQDSWRAYVAAARGAMGTTDPAELVRLDRMNRALATELGAGVSSALVLFGNEKTVPVLTSGFFLAMLRGTGRTAGSLPLILKYEENGSHELILT